MRRAAIVLVALAACAAQKQSVAPAMNRGSDPHARIQELSNQIDSQRAQLQLPEPPSCEPNCTPAVAMARTPSYKDDAQCHPGQSQTCSDACTLSDSICKNADEICDLAGTLAGDSWAAQKCNEGKATCDAAKAKCCACQR